MWEGGGGEGGRGGLLRDAVPSGSHANIVKVLLYYLLGGEAVREVHLEQFGERLDAAEPAERRAQSERTTGEGKERERLSTTRNDDLKSAARVQSRV
jgi:hypothetical protein